MSYLHPSKSSEYKQQKATEHSSSERVHRPLPSNQKLDILTLQRSAGNQAVTQLLRPGKYSSLSSTQGGLPIQYAVSAAPMNGVPPIVYDVLTSPGQPLDVGTRAFMEPRFGHDFNRIPIHSTQAAVPQTKLKVNQPGDIYEQEADQVAEHITQIPPSSSHIQRQCACGGIVGADGECEACKQKRLALQPRATAAGEASLVPPVVHEVLQSQGQPLDPTTQSFMRSHFGYDFSRIQVHTDTQATESAQAVHALAYTVGSHIVFGPGQYAPNTTSGRRLLAHELTHTIQQQETARVQRAPTATGDRDEKLDEVIGSIQQAIAGASSAKEEKGSSQVLHSVLANLLTIKGAGTEDQVQHAKLSIVATIEQYFEATKQPMRLQQKAIGGGKEDKFEREAEAVATRVMQGRVVGDITQGSTPMVQRQAAQAAQLIEEAAPYVAAALAVAYAWATGLFKTTGEAVREEIRRLQERQPKRSPEQPTQPKPPVEPPPKRPPPFFPPIIGGGKTPGQQKQTQPQSQTQTRPRDKREECLEKNPTALTTCDEASMDRDELVMRYLLEHYDFGDIGDFQWQIWRDFDPKFAADACDGKAPTQTWHCYVRIKNRKERVKVSVFGCLCCHDDGTTGFEWRGAH